ncbi:MULTISPECIES: hypothetical protein [unclassified Streptomyces]|uniref:hypothetical protein n=1 Tax=unclassified Streptomyces TaxID=2593676 RepID=UPI0037F9D76E
MDDSAIPALQALPDGEAELRLTVRLGWEDLAALGQEAGRLSARMQRPVTLDEAVAHRLRGRASAGPKTAGAAASAPAVTAERGQQLPQAPSPVSSLTARSPGEHARQAIEKINTTGSAGQDARPTSA